MKSTQKLREHLQEGLPNYLELLRQMVEINSFTANSEGVNQLAELTADIFAPLGFQAEFLQSTNPIFGKHMFLSREPVNEIAGTLALVSHLDTVFSKNEESKNDFQWRPEGDRIYGPGTIDIKGGTLMIYMMLDVLSTFFPQIYDSIHWIIGLNASEETLAQDFAALLLERLANNCLACLVFESGLLVSESQYLVVARKGRATYHVQVEGRSAHAGSNHPQGANAIVQIAHTIQQIASFTDYEQQITFNVGTLSGGSVVNRVPHHAEATVEMRAFSTNVFNAGLQRILALDGSSQISSHDGFPCRTTIQVLDQTAPWPRNEGTDRLFKLWSETGNQLGMQIIEEERGGLSDGNLLWEHFPTLDGLGPSGANSHCSESTPDGSKEQEYVFVPSFVPKAILNTMAIVSLIERGR